MPSFSTSWLYLLSFSSPFQTFLFQKTSQVPEKITNKQTNKHKLPNTQVEDKLALKKGHSPLQSYKPVLPSAFLVAKL